jgi:hypothetical protein
VANISIKFIQDEYVYLGNCRIFKIIENCSSWLSLCIETLNWPYNNTMGIYNCFVGSVEGYVHFHLFDRFKFVETNIVSI